jgi:hypothetical protein
MTTSLGTLVQSILDAVKNDALKDGLPVVNNFLQSIIANSSVSNIAAQAAALQVNLLAALPNFESDLAKDVAVIVQNAVNALTTSTAPKAG